jgi:PAP2 superfamily C-terminal
VRRLFRGRPDADVRRGLALRYPASVWVAVLTAFVVVHYLLFGFVHNIVDTRPCLATPPDPLLKIIPFDTRWMVVTLDAYVAVTAFVSAMLILQAVRGVHTPALRWTLALVFMSSMRMGTLLLIPLCRPTLMPGGPPPLASPEMLNLGFVSIPMRIFALNDLVYSGHTALFLMLLRATGTWPPISRFAIGGFLTVLAYGLLSTRDHYTVDILLAFPCSYFADSLSVVLLRAAAHFVGRVPA